MAVFVRRCQTVSNVAFPTHDGFKICDLNFEVKVLCTSITGGLSICVPIKKSNFFLVVGSGRNKEDFPQTKLLPWVLSLNKTH